MLDFGPGAWQHSSIGRCDNPHRQDEPLFELGQLMMTPGVAEHTDHAERMAAITRHVQGDWGNVPPEDAQQNEWALENSARILSSYVSESRIAFWIITEADRSATTLLLPEEY